MELSTILPAESSVDAVRFLKRGTSLLDAVVLIKRNDNGTLFNGMRITPELVISLPADPSFTGTDMTVNEVPAEIAWSNATDALLLRTPRYDGLLPDLSVASYQGSVTLVSSNPVGESRLAFGRTQADARHDVPTEPGSLGAPLFDDAWRLIGLHKSRDLQGARTYVPIVDLVRQLEQSPCWDEIAAIHRLARSAATEGAGQEQGTAPDLTGAVHWSTDGRIPMSERERRRAIAGKTLDELRRARGSDPATSPEQRAVDRILAGPPYVLDTIVDDILLPFATAARWFRCVVPDLPDDEALEREVRRRRQVSALVAIVGPHFAPREQESERLRKWLADRDRAALVIRGPGGIGKSAFLAHFILENTKTMRFVWLDFDRPDMSADEPSITRAVDQQLAWQAPGGPLLVVLDSFETAVQTYGYTNLNPALDALAARFDDLAVVVGSRAPVPLLRVQGEPAQEWELPGLPLHVVTQWLLSEGIMPNLAVDIALVTNGVPLNMKLARDLMKGKSGDEARETVDALPKQLVTGYLYRRILRRLRDDTLKDLAQWAMVPRRVTPALLAAVLQVTKEESERLFTALRSELTLLEGDTVLTVRADLRNTLLPLLEAEDTERVREIDTVAADFWAERASDDIAAAEAVYHALRIGDIPRAQSLWRSELVRHLGGYTMEELPEASQAWLEARLSRESAERATEALVADGSFLEAAATLRGQPQGVTTLNARKRGRAIQELAAGSSSETASAAADTASLEAIVLENTRPALRVRDGTFTVESATWSHLERDRPTLESAIACTGRIQLADGSVLGTASRIGPDLFVTTRSIVEQFAVGIGHGVELIAGRNPAIDMRAEGGTASEVHAITRVVLIHPYWDIAIFTAPIPGSGAFLKLATREPAADIEIAVVGHPARNEHEDDLLAKLFNSEFNVKRLMPGKYRGRQAEASFGRTVSAGLDNATALSADFGAPVVDVSSGELIGVRFSWVFLDNAKFVPAWELARDPEIAKAGVSLGGTPLAAPGWTSGWTTVAPARHTLLEAYVARTSGDLPRARALLDVVADDDTARIDRTLLEAACTLTTDSLHSADLLQGLIERTPNDAWPSADRDAAIATRLRLVVDSDAEQAFLQILQKYPTAVSLLDQRHFRVLVPPGGDLPWNRPVTVDGIFPLAAGKPAKRIVDASNRCLSLRGWIEANARDLLNLSYLFDRSTDQVRELAAAYVTYPFEMVRSVTDFLLEKTDLAPHPTAGWTPVIEPLFMMFREARGGLPGGVRSAKDLEGWLDSNAGSGRLGSYLTERLRFDSRVAWQAGLLHLTTELPIESLLKRRFSGSKS